MASKFQRQKIKICDHGELGESVESDCDNDGQPEIATLAGVSRFAWTHFYVTRRGQKNQICLWNFDPWILLCPVGSTSLFPVSIIIRRRQIASSNSMWSKTLELPLEFRRYLRYFLG